MIEKTETGIRGLVYLLRGIVTMYTDFSDVPYPVCRKRIAADGKNLSFVTVTIFDAAGNVVPKADNLVQFSISGAAFITGVDNGNPVSHKPFKSSLWQGVQWAGAGSSTGKAAIRQNFINGKLYRLAACHYNHRHTITRQ